MQMTTRAIWCILHLGCSEASRSEGDEAWENFQERESSQGRFLFFPAVFMKQNPVVNSSPLLLNFFIPTFDPLPGVTRVCWIPLLNTLPAC